MTVKEEIRSQIIGALSCILRKGGNSSSPLFLPGLCASCLTSLSEACIRPPIYVSSVLSEVAFPLLSCSSVLSQTGE